MVLILPQVWRPELCSIIVVSDRWQTGMTRCFNHILEKDTVKVYETLCAMMGVHNIEVWAAIAPSTQCSRQ